MDKVRSLEELARECESWRSQNKVVVWTNGCFDLLHAGHVRALEAARALGDVLVLGLNSDASIRQLKGSGRPICNEEDRAVTLGGLECVDRIVFFDTQTCDRELAAIKPDIWTKSGDYTEDSLNPYEKAAVLDNNGRIVITPLIPGISTTLLVKKIQRFNPEVIIPAACTVIHNAEGEMLMVKTRYMDSRKWSPPGGGHTHGETLMRTAVRETCEETGYGVALGGLLGVVERIEPSVDLHLNLNVFRAELAPEEVGKKPGSRDEAIEDVAWFSRDRMRGEGEVVVGRRIWLEYAWDLAKWPPYILLEPGEE